MPAPRGRGDPGFYPERDARPGSALERLAGRIAWRTHALFARELRPGTAFADEVGRHAAAFRAAPLAAVLPALRYRLRRDGLAGEGLAQCFGLCAASFPAPAGAPSAEAIAAAAALTRGGIVDLADALGRWQALALAASAFAMCGVPVHLYAASDERARQAAARLSAPLGAMGLGAAAVHAGMGAAERRVAYGAGVVCATHRVIAFDYMRDRMQLGRRLRPLQSRLERLSGDTTSGAQMLLLNGLHCALVEDADAVLLDDARLPTVVSADAAASSDLLPYEQALELAQALDSGADYEITEQGAQLSAQGTQKLAELCVLLGGQWTARQRRDELVAAALVALHALQRGRDYHVAQGALQFAPAGPGEDAGPPELLQHLLEAKEGLAFGGRRAVLARLSVPQFFRRYLRLAGICADARGLEEDFWSMYGLRAQRAGRAAMRGACTARTFVASARRRAALAASVRERAARGAAVVVAVRTGEEAAAVSSALEEVGVRFGILRGAGTEEERALLEGLERPGSVALSLFPAQRAVTRAASASVPLHVAVADLHDAARHLALIASAYAAHSCEQFLALEDKAVAPLLGRLRGRLTTAGARGGELAPAPGARLAAGVQRAAERAAARARRDMLAREQAMEELLAFSGRPE